MMIGTRAVEKNLLSGNQEYCSYEFCSYPRHIIISKTRFPIKEIIANVYFEDKWQRVEHFHSDCYDKMGNPYGPVIKRRK